MRRPGPLSHVLPRLQLPEPAALAPGAQFGATSVGERDRQMLPQWVAGAGLPGSHIGVWGQRGGVTSTRVGRAETLEGLFACLAPSGQDFTNSAAERCGREAWKRRNPPNWTSLFLQEASIIILIGLVRK